MDHENSADSRVPIAEGVPAFLGRFQVDNLTSVYVPSGSISQLSYADGGEKRILDILRTANDISSGSSELLLHVNDFISRYHLSPERQNLLWPLRERLKGRVLEVGAGCGALSRFLGEQGADLYALEGSLERASVCRERCRDLPNVKVLSANLSDIPAEPFFDVVVLAGVLEYSRIYFGGESGPAKLLVKCREMLRPNGVLVLAIENQLGLKYFAGAFEDHLGVPFLGLQDQYAANTQVTFGKWELEGLLLACGFRNREFLYPFPDYKFPRAVVPGILLRDFDVNVASLLKMMAAPDQQKGYVRAFAEELAWPVLLRNRLAEHLANSFLVICSPSLEVELNTHDEISVFSGFRRKCFTKATLFNPRKGPHVRRVPLHAEQADPAWPFRQVVEAESLFRYRLLIEDFFDVLNRPGWTEADVAHCAKGWVQFLRAQATADVEKPAHEWLLAGHLFDCIPSNLAKDDAGGLHAFDQEWVSGDPIPLNFLVCRGVLDQFLRIQSLAEPGPICSPILLKLTARVMHLLGVLPQESDVYELIKREAVFQDILVGWGIEQFQRMYEQLTLRLPRLSDARAITASLAITNPALPPTAPVVPAVSAIAAPGTGMAAELEAMRQSVEALEQQVLERTSNARQETERATRLDQELEASRRQQIDTDRRMQEILESRAWRIGSVLGRIWRAVTFRSV